MPRGRNEPDEARLTASDRVRLSIKLLDEVLKPLGRKADRGAVTQAVERVRAKTSRAIRERTQPGPNLPASVTPPIKEEKRAAKSLLKAVRGVEEILGSPELHRLTSFAFQSEAREQFGEIQQQLAELSELAKFWSGTSRPIRGLFEATKPKRRPDKKIAAEVAYDLITLHGLEPTVSRGGSDYLRLAAIVYGNPTVDLYHPCRHVSGARRQDQN